MMFAGTFEQALDALRTESRDSIHKFMSFMDAHPSTVGGWLIGTSKPPTGETKIRALCYFKLNDWRVREFESLEPLAQSMALLLGLRVTTLAEMLNELGLAESYGNGILGFLYGEKELTKQARKLAQLLVAAKAAEVEQASTQLLEQFSISPESTHVPMSSSDSPTGKSLAFLLREAYPLAKELNSDSHTDEERAEMRLAVGPDQYVELSVMLNVMRSSRTRRDMTGKS